MCDIVCSRAGWLAGWLGGWLDGWMDGWMDGWVDNGKTVRWTYIIVM